MASTPQFGKAEYLGQPSSDRCRFCQQPLANAKQYFRVNGAMACAACAEKAKFAVPSDEHSAFMRALVCGAGAAVAGFVLYAGFAIATGWMIGYVSLAVGYMVGKAMLFGSKGLGGRRYQIAAVLLTYAAVSMAAIPIYVAQLAKEQKAKQAQTQQQPTAPANATNSHSATPSADQSATPAQTAAPAPASRPAQNGFKVLGALLFVGLASPFLELADPIHGLIGLVILFVGIQIAWKLTAGRARPLVDGPFDNPAPKPL